MQLLMKNVLQGLAQFVKSFVTALIIFLVVSVFTPIVFIILGLVMSICYPFDKEEVSTFFLRMVDELPRLFREVE